ncbi:MAG: insulinase family protein [Gemmataceae bacterium]|nr:insulinase family protein [Gemmataceae bacterium]
MDSRQPFLCAWICSLALALQAGPLFAQEKSKESGDKVLQAAMAVFANIREEALPNGLRVYLKPIPGATTVTTMVAYKVGSADEDLDQTGLSHYLEHLLFKGTDKLFPGDIDRLTLRNGGANNAYTSEDITVYHFDFSADRWEQALEIEADRMRNLRIDERHEFQQEKGAVIEELRRNEDAPWDLEYKAILPKLFGAKAPYGHPVIGQTAHVRGATADTIKRHYDRWYHPNNACLVVCGGFDPDSAMEKIRRLFGPIPKGTLSERKAHIPPTRQDLERLQMTSRFEVNRLLIGFNTVDFVHADGPALTVLEAVLSDGKTSRLYRKLIEGEEIASEAAAESSLGRYPGWFGIQVELLQGQELAKAEKLVFAELDKLTRELITEKELSRVRQKLLASAVFSRESVHGLANAISSTVILADLKHLQEFLPRLLKVSPEDLKRVAAKYFRQDSAVALWSVPAGKATGASNSPREKQPARASLAEAKEFSFSKVRRVVLPSGLVLLLHEDHRNPVVVLSAALRDSRAFEPDGKYGLATLTGSLLDEGLPGVSGQELAESVENIGGELSLDELGGTVKVLSHNASFGIETILSCLQSAVCPKEAFERKQKQVLSTLADLETQTDYLARREFLKAVYGEHPRGRPSMGTQNSVKKITREDCVEFRKLCFQPSNIILAVSGDINPAEVEKQIRQAVENWTGPPLKRPKFAPLRMPDKFTQVIHTMEDSVQMQFYMGHAGIRRNDPDYYKLLVMDHILGTGPGFTDRLSARLRDREGLAYTVSAAIAGSADTEPGAFMCYIGTDAANFARVKKEFLEEIERIRDTLPSREELNDSRNYLLGNMAFRFTTNGSIANQMLSMERLNLGSDCLEKYRLGVASVTAEDIREVARKHLHPDKLTLIAVGPLDAEGNPLKKK